MQVPDTLAELAVPIDDVHPYEHNPRRGDLAALRKSLEAHGQYRPIVANRRTSEVLAGNHTWQAAKALGWDHIAVTWVDVDDEAAARIVLVDNRTNDLSGYDDAALAELLSTLPDLTGTGYDDTFLAELLSDEDEPVQLTDPDQAAPLPKAEPISKAGDVWTLGKSTLLVGDATDTAAVLTAIDDDELDAADDAVLLEVQRVDRLHTALWPRAVKGDLGALDRLMRLSERRLALLDKARLNDTPPHAGTVSIGRASTGAAATR